jgi:hypothetical protein
LTLAIASNPNPTIVTDDVYDRDRASDGFSRYGAYLGRRLPAIVDGDPDVLSDPVRWASFAWATAAPPVMSPGYVEWRDPIEDIQVGWDEGQLVAEIIVRTTCPLNLPGWRTWERDLRGNLVESWYGRRVALTRTTLRATLREVSLPLPPVEISNRRDVVRAAKSAVQAVVNVVEHLLRPVLVGLESDGSGFRP